MIDLPNSVKTGPAMRLVDQIKCHIVDRASRTAVKEYGTNEDLIIVGDPMDVMRRFASLPSLHAEYDGRIDEWNVIILIDAKALTIG